MSIENFADEFSDLNFDARVYASKIIRASNVATFLRLIDNKIQDLKASIYDYVAANNKSLFKRASNLDCCQNQLQLVNEKALILSTRMQKIKNKINSSFENIKQDITEFQNLQRISSLLFYTSRVALLTKRVSQQYQQNGLFKDLNQTSLYVNELEFIFENIEWKGIDILELYRESFFKRREDLISQSWKLVNSSYELSDQTQLAVGLHVFYNLNMLFDVIHELVSKWKADFHSFLANAVDADKLTQSIWTRLQTSDSLSTHNNINSNLSCGPGRASLSLSSSSTGSQAAAAFHVSVWTSLDKTFDKLEQLILHCRLLGLALSKKRDLFNDATSAHRSVQFYNVCPNLSDLLVYELVTNWQNPGKKRHQYESFVLILYFTDFKTKFVELAAVANQNGFLGWASGQMAKQLSQASKLSTNFREVLETEYPKLLKLVLDFDRRLRLFQTGDLASTPTELPVQLVTQVLQPFETAYLSRSLSRLFDVLTLAFSTVTVTVSVDQIEIGDIVQSAMNELVYAMVHYEFLCQVSRNLDKLIGLFETKVESLICPINAKDDDLKLDSSSHQTNVRLVNLLCSFGSQLSVGVNRRFGHLNLESNRSKQSPVVIVHDSIDKHLVGTANSIVNTFLKLVESKVRYVLDDMHGQKIGVGDSKCKYLEQIEKLISQLNQSYIKRLSRPTKQYQQSNSLLTFLHSVDNSLPIHQMLCGQFLFVQLLPPTINRLIDCFLWNLSMVRVTDDSDDNFQRRRKLASECVAFEAVLSHLWNTCADQNTGLNRLSPQGYQKLKGFQTLLLQSTEEIVLAYSNKSPPPDNQLDVSLACQHLFSRAPLEISLPHRSFEWSTIQFVDWILAKANDKERLVLLRNALQVYARQVQIRKQKEYPLMYLKLKEFLDNVLDQ